MLEFVEPKSREKPRTQDSIVRKSQKQLTASNRNCSTAVPTWEYRGARKSQIDPTKPWLGRRKARARHHNAKMCKNWETAFFFPFLGLDLLVILKRVSFVHYGTLIVQNFQKKKIGETLRKCCEAWKIER